MHEKDARSSPLSSLLGQSVPLVPPLYQSSVYALPDLDAVDAIMSGQSPGFFYARDGHPNARLLADALAALEEARWAVICASGMAALSAAVLALVQHGDRIVASNRLYGKTTQLLHEQLPRYGVTTTFVDTCDLAQVGQALTQPAKLLLVETISNPLLRVADVRALVKLAHSRGCQLLVDNTFATPVLLKPLALGADLVVESLTKILGGHSDVTLGVLCGNADIGPKVAGTVSCWGLASNPFDCWLAQRGLETVELRVRAATANAQAVAEWLAAERRVARVVYPGLAEHADHALAQTLLPDGCGHMLCFELDGGRDAVNRFLRRAPEIPFSPSLGHTMTTLSHPWLTSHRYVSAAEKKAQGITEGLIRLSVGCEPRERILAALAKGLA